MFFSPWLPHLETGGANISTHLPTNGTKQVVLNGSRDGCTTLMHVVTMAMESKAFGVVPIHFLQPLSSLRSRVSWSNSPVEPHPGFERIPPPVTRWKSSPLTDELKACAANSVAIDALADDEE